MKLEPCGKLVLREEDVLAIPTRFGEGTPLDRRLWCGSYHYIPIPPDCPGLPEAVEACDHVRRQAPGVFWCVRDREHARDDADYVANTLYALKHFGYVHGRYGGLAGKRCALQILSVLEDSCHVQGEKNADGNPEGRLPRP